MLTIVNTRTMSFSIVKANKLLGRPRPHIIKLHSSNPDYYRSDQLYKLIPEIVNPGYNGLVNDIN